MPSKAEYLKTMKKKPKVSNPIGRKRKGPLKVSVKNKKPSYRNLQKKK